MRVPRGVDALRWRSVSVRRDGGQHTSKKLGQYGKKIVSDLRAKVYMEYIISQKSREGRFLIEKRCFSLIRIVIPRFIRWQRAATSDRNNEGRHVSTTAQNLLYLS